jgi:sulfotransferase family protein
MDARRLVRRVQGRARKDGRQPTYLFVVTYGRSGSTLVQGLLNSLPGTLVRGENNFFILPLFTAWSQLERFHRQHAKEAARGVESAFYGLDEMNPDDVIRVTRDLVTRQLCGSVNPSSIEVLGFKEVLWHRIGPRQTEAFFTFFEAVFPNARYILNRRDLEQVAASGFWRSKDNEEVAAAVSRVEQIQDYLRDTRPERTHDIRYEVLTSADQEAVEGELRSLAEFVVDRSDAVVVADLRAAMEPGYGPRPFGRRRGAPDEESANPP